ncbi:hypothetical protein [Bifidobacterium aquikefiricola]|uniref:DUF4192 family protein n=1 Tax=Bifidobacterium aquikefiricola TaxID=3059038 RepID=A0AB39U491_9BIFI
MTTSIASAFSSSRTRKRDGTAWNKVVRPIEEWLALIESSSGTLSVESTRILDASMKHSKTLRDLLILSMLGNEECRNSERIRTVLENPDAPSSAQIITNNLDEAFAHATDLEMRRRCNRGLAILEYAIEHAGPLQGTALLAIITYLKWWMGDRSAFIWAQACLKRDSHCTMAAIILTALEEDMFPAQCED